MGTRNITAVFLNGEYKVAQYCQWDGYPSGQGLTALKFLWGADPEEFEHAVLASKFVTKDELHERWKEVGADDSGFVSFEISKRFEEKYPTLHRNVGADVLSMLPAPLVNQIDFVNDSLFCEWCYVVDLDAGVFEVYQGFNQEEPVGRFHDWPGDGKYKPVTLVASWPLDALPTEEAFLEELEPEELEDA